MKAADKKTSINSPKRPIKKRTSQAEIAAKLGIHQTTVSAVLLGKKNVTVKPRLRERILREVFRSGYRPSLQARLLRGGRSGAIGILHFGGNNPVSDLRIQEIVRTVHLAGFRPLVFDMGWFEDSGLAACETLLDARVEALVVSGASDFFDFKNLEVFSRGGIPVVFAMGLRLEGWTSFHFDQEEHFRMLASHLISNGCSSLAFLGREPSSLPHVSKRLPLPTLAGVYRAMDEVGLPRKNVLVELNPSRRERKIDFAGWGSRSAELLLKRGKVPEGILCYNDIWALGTSAVFLRNGFKIPEDIKLTGYGDTPISSSVFPSITTIRLPMADLAGAVVEILTSSIQKRKLPAPIHHVLRGGELIVRECTHRPKRVQKLSISNTTSVPAWPARQAEAAHRSWE